jgi:hypothetical protein
MNKKKIEKKTFWLDHYIWSYYIHKQTMSSWGNGGYNPIPGNNFNNIFSSSVPNGTYGACLPTFGSLGNYHTSPQLTAPTIVKGNGYVRVESNDGTGKYTVYNNLGQVTGGNY